MLEWQLDKSEYLNRLGIGIDEFVQELKIPAIAELTSVIPFRDLVTADAVIPVSREFLAKILDKMTTLDGRKPYQDVRFSMVRFDPSRLKIGQRFVYRENYQRFIESVPVIFEKFLISPGGLGTLGAFFVFGKGPEGEYALSVYLPPIVESHPGELVLMDGIHRNYVAKQTGQTVHAILIEGRILPFPCSTYDFAHAKVIPLSEKPADINERYFDLEKGLFRDLKYLGIDG